MANALVLNAGSSSLKFSVYRAAGDWSLDASGQIDRIGDRPKLTIRDAEGHSLAERPLESGSRDVRGVLDVLSRWLTDRYGSSTVLGVGHRVVHGGIRYVEPCVVTTEVLDNLRALVPLAPLHQPFNLMAIEAVHEHLPGVPQVACFDTAFHSGLSAIAKLVPLPAGIRDAGVQRYGFHGISYEFIASVLPKIAPEIADGRVIVAHLGNGASLCAMRNRKSVDTTMSFTTLDGLCMGTRPGSIDPGVVLYLMQIMGRSTEDVERILYHESGLQAVSGISQDMRDLENRSDPRARLAIDYFVYQTLKHVGALTSVLGGLDALVFTAGIGEHSAMIRQRICEGLSWLGITLDAEANGRHERRISPASIRPSVWVIPTDEERMIVQHTASRLGIEP
jgi:acetate kinase